ncbi:ABC transporter [Paracoccus suum]|uniref:ABC transporter n=1 Tax=Paracoccus suum TaxID=2259340 RepID=A0A344PH61_9RHOB|nr:ABC transporter permease [Paracoccus suum]AXC48716.1 ABC transporter [Paracoccus suum]
MFVPTTRNRTMLDAATSTLSLIYTVTVHNLRATDRNPIIGLLMTAVRSVVMIAGFMSMYYLLGVRTSPVRGDFLVYVMSGVFLYQAHTMAVQAVAGAGGSSQAIMKHGPMTTAVVISAGALSSLYRTTFAALAILGIYYLVKPFTLEDPVGAVWMMLLAWFSGAAIGMIFLAIKPWAPQIASIGTNVYSRVQMVASGKMFLANALPGFMIHYFDWNPLFHVIDQARGYAFINYTPHHSSVTYPVYFSLAVLMIGLMAEFVTRRAESVSWAAAR